MQEAIKLGAKAVVLVDGDGQHEVEYLDALVAPVIAGKADFVLGSRYLGVRPKSMPAARSLAVRLVTALSNAVFGCSVSDAQCGFRALSDRAARQIAPTEPGMEASLQMIGLAASRGLRIEQVPVGVTYEVDDAHSKPSLLHGLGLAWYLFNYPVRLPR